MGELFDMVKSVTEANRAAFYEGHKAGYALGFKEGVEHAIKKAMEVINTPPKVQP